MTIHYSSEEWNEFKRKDIDPELKNKMQMHLLECDECLNLYLLSVDDNEIKAASEMLPCSFTEDVINRIKLEDSRINAARKKTYFTNILIYYISAACITLFLMSQGVFHSIFDNVPAASSILANNTSKSEKILINGWTDQLAEKTSLILNGLLNNNRRDSFEK